MTKQLFPSFFAGFIYIKLVPKSFGLQRIQLTQVLVLKVFTSVAPCPVFGV